CRHAANERRVVANDRAALSVAAGEVVHVGTLVYLRSDPAELRVTANLEDARTALRAVWPAGANRLIERRMLVGPAQP
ncbi:MAG: hypothetical protein ACK5XA_14825, partial [Tagaea sp.]